MPAILIGTVFWGHFLITGEFSGYLSYGFVAAFLAVLAVVFFVVGIIADMLVRIRANQERILYRLKKFVKE